MMASGRLSMARVAVLLVAAACTGGAWGALRRCTGDPVLEHLNTKSPFCAAEDLAERTAPPATCRAASLNLVNRHGSRGPGDSDIAALIGLADRLAELQDRLDLERFPWMADWQTALPLGLDKELTEGGKQELYEIGRAFKAAFPELFSESYDPVPYDFQATFKTRTGVSAQAFGYGVFENTGSLPGGVEPIHVFTRTEEVDYVLRFEDNCPHYVDTVKNNETTSEQADKWAADNLPALLSKYSARLGATVPEVWELDQDDLEMLVMACWTEVLYGVTDQWCGFFDVEDLWRLEFWDDLEDSYEVGPSNALNIDISAELVKDIVDEMDASLAGSGRLATLRFGHSDTVGPLAFALGILPGAEDLEADDDPFGERVFRQSQIIPFAANIGLVLYECDDGPKVQVFHNLAEKEIDGCGLFCPYDEFKQRVGRYLDIDFPELCRFPDPCVPSAGLWGLFGW